MFDCLLGIVPVDGREPIVEAREEQVLIVSEMPKSPTELVLGQRVDPFARSASACQSSPAICFLRQLFFIRKPFEARAGHNDPLTRPGSGFGEGGSRVAETT